MAPWVEEHERLPGRCGDADANGEEDALARKPWKLEALADHLPPDVQEQLEEWRRRDREAEVALYKRRVAELAAFLI